MERIFENLILIKYMFSSLGSLKKLILDKYGYKKDFAWNIVSIKQTKKKQILSI